MPKYVVSKTLKKAEWNNSHIISDNIVEETQKLKEMKKFLADSSSEDGNILVAGSGELVRFLMKHDLVDQFNLLVYPVVLGEGKQLFDGAIIRDLKLIESQAFSSGVTKLIYAPK